MTAPDLLQVMRARVDSRAKFEWLVLPVSLGIVCIVLSSIAAIDNRWHEALDYRRADIAADQWWRLVTAHLMHLNAAHVALDVAAFILVAWIFSRDLTWRRQALALLIGAGFVDAGLWFFHPEVARYVGLSGALHALFAAGATCWLLEAPTVHANHAAHAAAWRLRRTWGAALLIGLVAKLAIENAGDAFWLHATGFDVVTAAHRWGSAGGAACGAAYVAFGRIATRLARHHS